MHSEPFTRIIEHKHFEGSTSDVTVITREYPKGCTQDAIPYYPVNDPHNQSLYRQYQERAASELTTSSLEAASPNTNTWICMW